MTFYGIWIEYRDNAFSGYQSIVLKKVYPSPPSQEAIDKDVEEWKGWMEKAIEERRTLYRVSKISKVHVLDFEPVEVEVEPLKIPLVIPQVDYEFAERIQE